MPIDLTKVNTVSADDFVKNEVAVLDVGRTVGTVANAYEAGSLCVFRDQSSLLGGATYDFEETTDTTFTLVNVVDADEVVWVNYIKK